MLRKNVVILLLSIFQVNLVKINAKEATCIINGRKSLNTVSERFLSFSIDPATLLTGLNISATSMLLSRYLSPAFIRISGPSTEFVQFSKNEQIAGPSSTDADLLTVTPRMWKSFNQWIQKVNLTPIYAIGDKKRLNGAWDPKAVLPFLNMNGEMGFDCYWQLGYDCGFKSLTRYKEDLKILRHMLEDHSSMKIVGSNLRSCLSGRNPELVRKTFEDLEGIADAVMWEQRVTNRGDISLNPGYLTRSYIPIWLTIPKADNPVTFGSGLIWARQIGEAAKEGYEVIFRQPRLHELVTDTPVFWISLIHKSLMGRNVLDVRINSLPVPGSYVYAHCAKRQNQYSKQGAMTVFVVNSGSYEFIASLRVASAHSKSIDVQSYIITSDKEDSTTTYLNGEKLTLSLLRNDRILFIPKLRRAKVDKLLNLNLPAKSVGFFVLPGARIPVCINKEDETHLLMEELEEDQNINFSAASSNEDISSYGRPLMGLGKLLNLIQQEFKADEEYYKKDVPSEIKKTFTSRFRSLSTTAKPTNDVVGNGINSERKKLFAERFRNLTKIAKPRTEIVGNALTTQNFRQHLISRTKAPELKPKDQTTKLEIIFTERPAKTSPFSKPTKTIELELSHSEIKKLLTDRAKSRVAEKNIHVTSAELENLMTKAATNFIRKESTTLATRPKKKRFARLNNLKRRENKAPMKRKRKNRVRERRDINMELLARKDKTSKNRQGFKSTARKFDSEELLRDTEQSSEMRDVIPAWTRDESSRGFSNRAHMGDFFETMEEVPIEELHPGESFVDEKVRFLMGADADESAQEDDLTNYHMFSENFESNQFLNPKSRVNNDPWNKERTQNTNAKAIKNEVKDFLADSSSSNKGKSVYNEAAELLDNVRHIPEEELDSRFAWAGMDRPGRRFRRDANITNSDVKNYKKFMLEQLRTMKQARKNEEGSKRNNEGVRRKNAEGGNRKITERKRIKDDRKISSKISKLKNKAKLLDQSDDDKDSFPNGQHLRIVIGKPYDPEKLKINERRRENQANYLKQRLENWKKKNDKAREKKKQQNAIDTNEESSRRKRTTSLSNDAYVPKARRFNSVLKQYRSHRRQKKSWKPHDLRHIKRTPSYSIEDLDNREFFQGRNFKSKLGRNRRDKREIDDDINITENEIEDEHFNLKPEVSKEYDVLDITTKTTETTHTDFTDLTSIASEDNETTTMTTNKPLEESTKSFAAVTMHGSIDNCTSNYKKTMVKHKVANFSSTETPQVDNTKPRNFVEDIISYVTSLFENIYNKISSSFMMG